MLGARGRGTHERRTKVGMSGDGACTAISPLYSCSSGSSPCCLVVSVSVFLLASAVRCADADSQPFGHLRIAMHTPPSADPPALCDEPHAAMRDRVTYATVS